VTQKDRALLRAIFDEAAELYDRARPGYPAALFDDLAELTPLRPGSRVLEIGPGTGQATLPLAERGYQVVAVELGADLAAVARRKLAGFPNVEVVTAAFEDWPLPAEPWPRPRSTGSTRPSASTRSPTHSGPAARSRPSPPTTSPVATSRSSPTSRPATSAGTPIPRPP
jgi:SAM-dependent methyltransferase